MIVPLEIKEMYGMKFQLPFAFKPTLQYKYTFTTSINISNENTNRIRYITWGEENIPISHDNIGEKVISLTTDNFNESTNTTDKDLNVNIYYSTGLSSLTFYERGYNSNNKDNTIKNNNNNNNHSYNFLVMNNLGERV